MDRTIDLTRNFLFREKKSENALRHNAKYSFSATLNEFINGKDFKDDRVIKWLNTSLLIGRNDSVNHDFIKYQEMDFGDRCFCCGIKPSFFDGKSLNNIGICNKCNKREKNDTNIKKYLQ